jgi:L-alanine-DL-glutamate epimerase-like enolase superfamily enzyme
MAGIPVRIVDVRHHTEDHAYRTPIKFGGVALDRATLLNAEVVVESADGTRASGFGSMPLGNVWSFPTRNLSYDQTLGAMRSIAVRAADLYRDAKIKAHPIRITMDLEPELFKVSDSIGIENNLGEPVPHLAALVAASPFDAALHDAYGKLFNKPVWHCYGPEYLGGDLGSFLGSEYCGIRLDDQLKPLTEPRLPLYHLVGALDPLDHSEMVKPVGDGLPETLEEWISRDGLSHLKIKLNGDDIDWDVRRVLRIEEVAQRAMSIKKITHWRYSLDFNERVPHEDNLLEFLARLEDLSPWAYARISYIEQPTKRDLKADRANTMHRASAKIPVVIDESLLDLETLMLAREMGYTGAALKACKGQSQSLLMAAAARKHGMFLCVQDLTCVGASLLHSASLAAWVRGISAIESNGRQYLPAANDPWADQFPGVFRIPDGHMATACLGGVGLAGITGWPK